jgi:putative membrane protein
LGQLAKENAASAEIKNPGAMMVKDHTAANEELKKTAKNKNITLPDALSDKSQKKVQELRAKKGTEFDEAYADLMVSDHKEDISAFKKEVEKGNDPQIRAWAKNKIPTLEHHLMMAEQAKKLTDKTK